MPVALPRLSVALHPVPDFLYEALVIARKHSLVNLVLLHSTRDIALAKEQPKEELSQTLHIATSPHLLGADDLPHLVEVSWPPYPANCSLLTPSLDMGLLVHVLWTLLQRQIAVRNHPPGTLTTTIPSTVKTLWASRRGSTPSLEYAFLPATLNTFQLLNDLAIHHGVGAFLQPSTYTPRSQLDLLLVMHKARDSWGWM